MITREELIKRGARFKGGGSIADEPDLTDKKIVVEEKQESQLIDTAPIANAMLQLSDVVKAALDANAPLINKLIELQSEKPVKEKPSEKWEFTISRDSRGRIETISASSAE